MNIKNRLSLLLLLGCFLCMGYASLFYYPRWKNGGGEALISWDAYCYYQYLPGIFIYHDLYTLQFDTLIENSYAPAKIEFYSVATTQHRRVLQYSCGQAIHYLPAFLIANFLAPYTGYPKDGFSPPYQLAIQLAALLHAFLGLWVLRKVLLQFYSDTVTGFVLVLIVLATNYLEYSSITNGMTHSWLFTDYVLLIYCTLSFYRQPKWRSAIAIGMLGGIMLLTRPTEIMAMLIPLGWGVYNLSSGRARFTFIARQWPKYLLAVILIVVLGSIQLWYWKTASGDWLFYSYGDEHFDFWRPHLKNGLFSFRNGWLIYTPVMVLTIPGFIFLYKKRPALFPVIFVVCGLFIYVTYSWSIWWYGGSVGSRAMIQCYALLAFPLASFLEMAGKKMLLRAGTLVASLCFIYLNCWMIHEAHLGGFWEAEGMTRAYYLKIAGHLHPDPESRKLLDTDEMFTGTLQHKKVIYQNNFDRDTSAAIVRDSSSGQHSMQLDLNHRQSPVYQVPFHPGESQWIRVSADFLVHSVAWNPWHRCELKVRFYAGREIIKERFILVQRLLYLDAVRNEFIDVRVPDEKVDRVTVQFINHDNPIPIKIDHLAVLCFDDSN